MPSRRFFLLLSLVCLFFAGAITSSAQYSSDTAKTIAPNDSAAVVMDLDHNQYWWKITTPGDGKLALEVRWATQPVVEFFVYDKDLTQVGRSATVGSAASIALDLGQETYYIRISRKSGTGTCTLLNRFAAAAGQNDPEPNDSADQAMTLSLGQSQSGHIGYYFTGVYDQTDWWTATTPDEGVLSVNALCDSTLEVDIILLDQNRVEIIRATSGASQPPLTQPLVGGKYYIKIQVRGGQGSYTFTASLGQEPVPGDAEPNDERYIAAPINVEKTVTGHLGFYGESGRDSDDVFTFSLTALWDSLYIRSECSPTLTPQIYLMDTSGVLGTVKFNGTTGYLVRPEVGSNISKVTYYVKVSREQGYGSYSFIISRSPNVPVKSSVAPPTDLTVSDVPNDNGHSLALSWKLSPDDIYISYYAIYRSRSSSLTTPRDLSTFTSLDALVAAEKDSTIRIAEVPKGLTSYVDPYVPKDGVTYYYWIQAVSSLGVSKIVAAGAPTAVREVPVSPFTVYPAFPNPFNPATTFRYEIPETGPVSLTVYDILGRKVTVLQDGILSAGVHDTIWNGTDAKGGVVSSGTYFYKVRMGGRVQGGKVLFLR